MGRRQKGTGTIRNDMYPQYWTPSIGGIFMKYSYEFKLMCVDMYRQGKWPDTPKEPDMKKNVVPAELTPSEREEMIRLRAENERMRAEIAVIKKEIALREERYAAQLKAKKQRSSKNSVKKDIH